LGGTLGLAKPLWDCHEHAERGSPTAARILLGLLRLQDLPGPKRRDVAEMDDDELAASIWSGCTGKFTGRAKLPSD